MKNRLTLICTLAAAGALFPPAWAATPQSQETIAAAQEPLFTGTQTGPRTRAEVREELRLARASGTMSLGGEVGDTQEVLAARDAFADLQREVVLNNLATLARQQSQGSTATVR